jgi:hypothetical protein
MLLITCYLQMAYFMVQNYAGVVNIGLRSPLLYISTFLPTLFQILNSAFGLSAIGK